MVTKQIATIALLLAISGLSFGTNQTTRPPSNKEQKDTLKRNRSSHPPAFDYRRGTSNWPYGPGYNFPYSDRPYGDPGHGGE
jgi:hypothetical protein